MRARWPATGTRRSQSVYGDARGAEVTRPAVTDAARVSADAHRRVPVAGHRGRPAAAATTAAGHAPPQELKLCWVFSSPSVTSDSTASAAVSTWNGSSLRSTVE